MKKVLFLLLSVSYFSFPTQAFAHEAYVLSSQDFHRGLQIYSPHPFAPLFDPTHWWIFLIISLGVALSYFLVLLFSLTKLSQHVDYALRKISSVGPLLIRLAISAAFFYSAQTYCILGPELSLQSLPAGPLIQIFLYLISGLLILGLFTRLAALISLVIFIYISFYFGEYLITYANYFGEIIALLIIGSPTLSLDSILFAKKNIFQFLKTFHILETPIVRIFYGVALIYAGYTIKFLHQGLTIEVYNQYHLERFFHATAPFIAAGAGLSEILIGLFILIGFFMRWTIFISLVFITLSLLYFREMVWPHLMLYGISLSLFINSADFLTIDHYLVAKIKKIL